MDVDAVWAVLADIPDPEIPTVSIVDLGIVRSVDLDRDRLRIGLLPTFVVIRATVEERMAGVRPTVDVAFSFDEPWTTDRITPRGRQGLLAGGYAPPTGATIDAARPDAGSPSIVPLDVAVPCPVCGSRRTRLENAFGPTLCRTIRYCLDCRQPFEAIKVV